MSYYMGDYTWRGDYYEGDYYQGDPGLFSAIGKAARGLISRTPIGAAVSTVAALVPRTASRPQPPTMAFGTLNPANANPNIQPEEGGITGIIHRLVPGGSTGYGAPTRRGVHPNKSTYVTRGGGTSKWPRKLQVHEKGSTVVGNRHMNVGNAKALRHALRRAYGFERLAMRTIRLLHPKKHGTFGGFKRRRRK
jgi:hypothetical protein